MIFDLYEDSSNPSPSKRNLTSCSQQSLPHVDWEAQMDALERQQEDIVKDQIRLLPKQIESLVRAVSQMKNELAEVKVAASQEHIESVVQQALAEFIGETADKHKEISDQQRIFNERAETLQLDIESFMSCLSDLKGEVAEIKEAASKVSVIREHLIEITRESKEKQNESTDQEHLLNDHGLRSFMEALSRRRIECAEVKEVASNENLESMIHEIIVSGKSGDKQKEIVDQQHILNEQGHLLRVGVESFKIDLSALKTEVAEIKHAASKLALVGQPSVEVAGECIQKHKETTDEQHILNDQIMEAISRMRVALNEVKEAASKEHMESVMQQLLAEFIGESADKHKTIVVQHEDFKTTTETHFRYIEGLIRDSADKHCVEISSAFAQIEDLHAGIGSCSSARHQTNIENRLDSLEKHLSESRNADGIFKGAVETRLQSLEKRLGSTVI